MQFIIRWLATAVAVGAAVWLVPGIARAGHHRKLDRRGHHRPGAIAHRHEHQAAVAVAQPAITCLTFGIFYLVVNTAMLYLAAWLSNGMFNVGFTSPASAARFRVHRHQHRVRHHELHRRRQLGERVRARHDAPGRGSSNYPAAPIAAQASETRCCPSKL